MGKWIGHVGDVDECRMIEDRSNVERGESGFFFQFAQSSHSAGLVEFDMSAGYGPGEDTVLDQDQMVGIRAENPSGGADVAGCRVVRRRTGIDVESSKQSRGLW